MLFLIALDMVFEKRTQRREARAEKMRETPRDRGRLGVPDGDADARRPGAIASVMLLVGNARGLPQTLVVLAALLAVLVLTLLALWAASPLMKLVGAQVEAVITRLLGCCSRACGAVCVRRDQGQLRACDLPSRLREGLGVGHLAGPTLANSPHP
jgi:multiple antibiotic resistance protein